MNLLENSTLEDGLAGWAAVGECTALSVHNEEPEEVPTETINTVADDYKPSGRYILAAGRAGRRTGCAGRWPARSSPRHVPRGRVDQPRRRRRGSHRCASTSPRRRRRVRRRGRRGVRPGRQVDGDQGRVPAQGEPVRRDGVRPGRARRRRREGDGSPNLRHGSQGTVQETQEED